MKGNEIATGWLPMVGCHWLLRDSQFLGLDCNAMTVFGRAAVITSVGLRDSSDTELQL